ncbi:MAG: hypothetical protein AB2693_32625 [Candidatus Thiodiazotropha sp.]
MTFSFNFSWLWHLTTTQTSDKSTRTRKKEKKMLIILLSLFVAGRCQTAEIDICRCNKEEIVIVCETDGGNLFLTKGTPGCHDSGMGLRVTGEGFVSGCDFKDTSMRDVFIQRSTLGCEDVLFHFPKATITLNGAVCRTSAAATTKVLKKFNYSFIYLPSTKVNAIEISLLHSKTTSCTFRLIHRLLVRTIDHSDHTAQIYWSHIFFFKLLIRHQKLD